MHISPDANAIRQRMEEVRCDLDEDVQEIVESTRDLSNWRSYVRSYPWVSLGVAVAIGYLIVPRRVERQKLDSRAMAELSKQNNLLVSANSAPKATVRGKLLAIVGEMVLREVASYVGQQVSSLLATQSTKSRKDVQA